MRYLREEVDSSIVRRASQEKGALSLALSLTRRRDVVQRSLDRDGLFLARGSLDLVGGTCARGVGEESR